jgi:hypothetical protein
MQRFLRVFSVCIGLSLAMALIYILTLNNGSFEGIIWHVAMPFVGVCMLAPVSAIALLIYEPHRGWRRLTLILALALGMALNILVYYLLAPSGGSFQFRGFSLMYPEMVSLIVFLMIGSRRATLWIKDGFSKSGT